MISFDSTGKAKVAPRNLYSLKKQKLKTPLLQKRDFAKIPKRKPSNRIQKKLIFGYKTKKKLLTRKQKRKQLLNGCYESDFVRYSKLSEDQAEAYYEDRKYRLHKELRSLMKHKSKFFKGKSLLNRTCGDFSILRSKMKKAQMNKFVIYNQVFWKKQMNKSAKKARSFKNSGKSK